jgi:outer membrane beta-barrel protein
MENRFRRFLLSAIACLVLASGSVAYAEDVDPTAAEEAELQPVIQPEVERTEFKEAKIDTEDFEITAFAGLLSIEDFGSNPVFGARLAYHVTEELFVEGTIGQSQAGETSYDVYNPGAPLLTDDESQFRYYNLSVGFNVLPGEAFVTQKTTYNNDLYLIGGIGSTQFAGSDRLTIDWGLGYRLFFTDYVALRIDFRDHMFAMDDYFPDKTLTHNLEITAGASFFF